MAYKVPYGIPATSVTSTATDIISGPVPATTVGGMVLSPYPGTYLTLFNSEFSTEGLDVTATAAADTIALAAYLNGLASTGTHSSTFGNETIVPGVYDIAGASTFPAGITVTLDAGGDPSALFVFRVGAAFSTGASSNVILINSANSANVFWLSGGAGSTGAGAVFQGTILADTGAASAGAGTVMTGRLLSTLGAVSLDSTTITAPPDTSVVSALGLLTTFALFTASGQLTNVGTSVINGDIGTNLGAVVGFSTATISGTTYAPGSSEFLAEYGIYVNGVLIADSARPKQNDETVTSHETIVMQTVATVLTGQTIDVRVSVDVGTVATENRILTIIKVE